MRLEKLEALRGLAAIYVVFHHMVPHGLMIDGINIGLIFRFGQEAVILFFIISGFVINLSFKNGSSNNFDIYFFKRCSRIYIPLIFVFILGYFFECLGSGGFSDPSWNHLVLNILMLQDVASLKPGVIVEPYLGNTPLWSLSYEWWFYMMYFPLQKYVRSERLRNILVFSIAGLASIAYLWWPSFILRVLIYLSIWWSGVYISDLVVKGKPFSLQYSWALLLGLGFIFSALSVGVLRFYFEVGSITLGAHPVLEARHLLFTLIAIISALLWKKFDWVAFRYMVMPFSVLAPISYVMYISHQYLIVNATYLSFIENRIFEVSGYLVVLILFSWGLERKLYPLLSSRLRKLLF